MPEQAYYTIHTPQGCFSSVVPLDAPLKETIQKILKSTPSPYAQKLLHNLDDFDLSLLEDLSTLGLELADGTILPCYDIYLTKPL